MTDYGIRNMISILIVCAAAYLIVTSGHYYIEKAKKHKWFTLVSNTSFEIYLLHQFIINALLIGATQMNINFFFVPLLSLILNLLVLPYPILINKIALFWIRNSI